jgi:hypothetical protein
MAAVTPTITNLSLGSVNAKLCYFSSVNSGDTWTSSITDIVFISGMMQGTGSTASTTGLGISWTASTGTISFIPASQAVPIRILVLSGAAY